MSALNFFASIGGNRLHLRSRVAAPSGRFASGRSSAIGRPFRVTVSASPRVTRSRTSAPWFRRSRIVTSSMDAMYHT